MTVKTTHKNILITGASSGIGREFACSLAAQAEKLWLCGRDTAELDATKAKVQKINPKVDALCIIADLTVASGRESIATKVGNQPVDLVILNAGGGNFGLFVNADWEAEQKVIDLNVGAVVHMAKLFIPKLIHTAKQSGRDSAVVFVSSHAAFMRIPHFSVYASCKSFVNSFALTLAQELRAEPIDVLVVCPGATRSKFSKRAGLPQKMLSAPADPATVVNATLRAIGKRNFLIVIPFDRILYLASRLLPVALFDGIVSRLQKKLLARAASLGGRRHEA